ncbi:MAG: putative DNA-binding domain-containing protein [Sphingobacteriales bacterium]|nr:putative DNA-binding domain-containing protein [Sphingobacteriales bacterium]
MQLLETTRQHQSALADYCRTGILTDIPGVNKDNISHYRRLVYNVIDDTLQSSYPLTYDLLTEEEWNDVVHNFFVDHSCQSPQVWYMPKEFIHYLIEVQHPLLIKYPFLQELLSFEWVEVELFMMEDKIVESSNDGCIAFNKLILNPEYQLLSYTYPVHNKTANTITEADKGNYFAVAYRNKEGDVIFTDLSPAFVRMLEYLAEEPATIKEIFEQFQQEFNLQLSEQDQQSVVQFFENAYQQQLITGFKP